MKSSTFALVCILGLGLAVPTTPAAAQTSTGNSTKTAAPATAKKTPAPAASGTHKTAATAGKAATLKDPRAKASYAIGMNLGNSLKKQSVDVDANLVAQGVKDAMGTGKTLLTEDEANAALAVLQASLKEKQKAKMEQAAEKNRTDGAAFLAANKAKPGVVTLPSGLQYKIITEGTGPKPKLEDSVQCNYRGMLIDGKEFDSSYKRGQPTTFPVNRVIPGWTEALQLMPVGSKWQLYIPSNLGYGAQGAGGDIGPNSTLIFDIELLAIPSAVKDSK